MGSFDDIGLTSKMLIQEHSSKPFVFISTQAIAIQNQIEYDGAMQKSMPLQWDKHQTQMFQNSSWMGNF